MPVRAWRFESSLAHFDFRRFIPVQERAWENVAGGTVLLPGALVFSAAGKWRRLRLSR